MKRRVCCALIYVTLAVTIVGCSVTIQDKPLPMSQEMLEKLDKELGKAAKSIAPSPSQDRAELVVDVYKTVIEKKMGFSFDKTFRNVMLFYPGPFMAPVSVYVLSDPKRALDKGFISQRTFDVLDMSSKAEVELTKKTEEFLGFVTECQNSNNGTCDTKRLFSVLAAHNALPTVDPSESEATQFESRTLMLTVQYLDPMGTNKLITTPNGQEIIRNALLSDNSEQKFIVNKNQIDISKRYTKMLAEEKVALSQ